MSDTQVSADGKLSVRLGAELAARVDEAARELEVGRSEFVRRAIADRVEDVLGRAGGQSLYDVLKGDGVIGRFRGPAGLSASSREVIRRKMARRGQDH